jgi:hypothetical protein
MQAPKRLEKFGIWYKGPHSAEMFKVIYIEPVGFECVVVGSGESKAVAAARAISHLRGEGFGAVMNEIEDEMQFHMPDRATAIEAPEPFLNVYCIVGVSAER